MTASALGRPLAALATLGTRQHHSSQTMPAWIAVKRMARSFQDRDARGDHSRKYATQSQRRPRNPLPAQHATSGAACEEQHLKESCWRIVSVMGRTSAPTAARSQFRWSVPSGVASNDPAAELNGQMVRLPAQREISRAVAPPLCLDQAREVGTGCAPRALLCKAALWRRVPTNRRQPVRRGTVTLAAVRRAGRGTCGNAAMWCGMLPGMHAGERQRRAGEPLPAGDSRARTFTRSPYERSVDVPAKDSS
jgi:hypothetical protein